MDYMYLLHPVKQKQYVFSSIAIEYPEYHGCPEVYTLKGKETKKASCNLFIEIKLTSIS